MTQEFMFRNRNLRCYVKGNILKITENLSKKICMTTYLKRIYDADSVRTKESQTSCLGAAMNMTQNND